MEIYKELKYNFNAVNLNKLELNKIAARWPAKAVAQFFLTLNKKQ